MQATEYVEATQFRLPLTPPFALYYTVLHCAKSFDTSKTTSVPPPPFPHPIHFLLYSPPSLPRSHATPFPRRKKRHREEEEEAEGPYVFLTGEGGRRGERTKGCSVSSLRRRKPDFLGTFPVSVGVERETKKTKRRNVFFLRFFLLYPPRSTTTREEEEGRINTPSPFLSLQWFFCVWVACC